MLKGERREERGERREERGREEREREESGMCALHHSFHATTEFHVVSLRNIYTKG